MSAPPLSKTSSPRVPLASLLLTGLFGSLGWYLAFLGLIAGATTALWFQVSLWPALLVGLVLGWFLGALLEARQIAQGMQR